MHLPAALCVPSSRIVLWYDVQIRRSWEEIVKTEFVGPDVPGKSLWTGTLVVVLVKRRDTHAMILSNRVILTEVEIRHTRTRSIDKGRSRPPSIIGCGCAAKIPSTFPAREAGRGTRVGLSTALGRTQAYTGIVRIVTHFAVRTWGRVKDADGIARPPVDDHVTVPHTPVVLLHDACRKRKH